MASLKMLRCAVRRRGSGSPPTLRYVPLEVSGLWQFLMVHRHGFEILDMHASIWVDVEAQPDISFSDQQFERVDEVCLHVYSEKAGMFRRICRYFKAEERDRLTALLLRHYAPHVYGDDRRPQVSERAGIWIVRES
jgi:hypothetical protein